MPPVKFNSVEVNIKNDAPLIGENNNEVLAELGYSEEEISEFAKENIIKEVTYSKTK